MGDVIKSAFGANIGVAATSGETGVTNNVETGERQRRIVALLEEALTEARAGRVVGVCAILIAPGADVTMNYSTENWLELLGAVARTQHRIQRDVDEANG